MKILFSFPGQGAQRPGMLQQLPGGAALLDEAVRSCSRMHASWTVRPHCNTPALSSSAC